VDYGKRPADPASKLRERSYLITHVWALLVALAHTAAQRRAVQASLREGKIVICDRYTLDSAVHLLDRYGPNRRFGPQIWLMHMLSPRPIRAYLVDVPAPVALERKADHFDLHELWRQAELYRRVAARLGVRMLDGQRTREELCQELAHDVWSELRPTVVP
jgi:thymidylate kinase